MGLKIVSYNCRSVKVNVHCVRELCTQADIVCLQETWLPIQELNFLNTIDENFAFYGISPEDLSSQLLVGRPFGGVAFLDRKSLSGFVTRIETRYERLICINLDVNSVCLRIINCYLPYDNGENDADVVNYLAKIHCIMNDHPDNNVIAVGDYNAHPQSRFGKELKMFCEEYDYVVCDECVLPEDTYTWVSDATGHTRWLDHCVCAASFTPRVANMHVKYDLVGSDHHALCMVVRRYAPEGTISLLSLYVIKSITIQILK